MRRSKEHCVLSVEQILLQLMVMRWELAEWQHHVVPCQPLLLLS